MIATAHLHPNQTLPAPPLHSWRGAGEGGIFLAHRHDSVTTEGSTKDFSTGPPRTQPAQPARLSQSSTPANNACCAACCDAADGAAATGAGASLAGNTAMIAAPV